MRLPGKKWEIIICGCYGAEQQGEMAMKTKKQTTEKINTVWKGQCATPKKFFGGEYRNARIDFLKSISCVLVVLLHSNAVRSLDRPYDYIALFLHLITRCAVPAFAGISGYYLLFSGKQYTAKEIYFRKVPRFLGLFLLWLFIAGTYSWYIEGKSVALWEFILINNDGFHLWYLKVYVGLLLIYPLLRAITKEELSTRVYCIIWLLAISLRFTLGTIGFVIPWVASYQPLFQIPFFHYHGYIGGTIAGNYPTEYIGIFFVMGYYIKLLEENKLGRSAKNTIIGIGMAGFVLTLGGSLYAVKRDGVFRDYFCNPIDIRMVFFALSVITIVYDVVKKEGTPHVL